VWCRPPAAVSPSTPPPPWHTPIKVRVLIVSPFPPAVTGGNGERVEVEPALRGTKNCHSPRPLPIFTPTQGVFCSYGPPITAETGWNALCDFHEKQSWSALGSWELTR